MRDREIRAASHLLHPGIIRVGLLAAVRSLAAQLDARLAIDVEADARMRELDDPAENQLPEPLRLSAYRVVEGALGNVVRHAEASRAEVRLAAATGRLEIEVRDDGRGFDPSTVRRGLGMSAIADRIDLADGSWSVASQPGRGTTLRASFPLG